MTAVDPSTSPSPSPSSAHAPAHDHPSPAPAEAVVDRFASPVPVANPALIGVPTFMVGSLALALVLTGFVPQALAGAPIAIIALATGFGQVTATIFALKAGESAVACVFGTFAGFWLSYAALVLGILHNWYGLTVVGTAPTAVAATGANILAAQKVFLLSWLIVIVILTLVSLRLPLGFTVLFVLVDIALLFVYLGTVNASASELKVGGYFAFGFIAVGAYLFLDAMTAATGGKNLPLGPPIIK